MSWQKFKSTLATLLIFAILAITATAYATLTSKIVLNVGTTYTGSSGLGTATETLGLDYSVSLTNGTGADQANVIFNDSRTLADAANETLDLYASGSLTDSFGNALTMETLKVLILYNTSTDATLLVGGGASLDLDIFADTSDILKIPPGGKFMFSAPNATGVDITTNKNLKLAHDGTGSSTLVYKIIAIGVD